MAGPAGAERGRDTGGSSNGSRPPPGATLPIQAPITEDFQVELQGKSVQKTNRMPGYVGPSFMGGVSPNMQYGGGSPTRKSGLGINLTRAPSEVPPTARSPSPLMRPPTRKLEALQLGGRSGTSVFGLRDHRAYADTELMGSSVRLAAQRPASAQGTSALDRVLLSSAFKLKDGTAVTFDSAEVFASADAFQLPPVKEKPGLSPSLLADLTKSQDYVTMGTITENYERITLNRSAAPGTFRQLQHEPKTDRPGRGEVLQNMLDSTEQLRGELPEELPRGVVTADDAVIFFVSGAASKSLVLYCNYAHNQAENYSPYDLVVVGMQRAEPEHFAISFGGVTHIRPGCDTEVTPLHEWTREKQLYSTVKRLPFFGKHALAKAFWRWTIGIRVKRYNGLRNKLGEDLLAASRLFGPSLRRIGTTLASINLDTVSPWRRDMHTGRWSLVVEEEELLAEGEESGVQIETLPMARQLGMIGSTAQAFGLEEFTSRRQRIHERVSIMLQSVAEFIKTQLQEMGTSVIKELDDAHPPEPTKREQRAARYRLPAEAAWRTSSMSQQTAAEREREARKSQSIRHGEMLGRFLRLCDVMLVAGLVELGKTSVREMLSQLRSPRRNGLLQIVGDMEPVAERDRANSIAYMVVFTPSLGQLKDAMGSLVYNMLSVVADTPRPLYFTEVAEYYDPFTDAKPPMVTTVMEFFQSILKLNQVRSQLEGKVENDYKMGLTTPSIATCVNSSVPYAFASSWDKDTYTMRNPSPLDVSTDLMTMRTWHSDLMATKNMTVSGLIHMDCTRLRNILIAPSMKVLTGMHSMLHTAFTEHAKRVLTDLQGIIQKLRKRPSEFPDFAKYMDTMAPHLSAAGAGRKTSSEDVATAKSLLFLLQPMLEKEEMMQLEAERQSAIREAEQGSRDGTARLSTDSTARSARPSMDGSSRNTPSPAVEVEEQARPVIHRTDSQRRRVSLVSTERELLNTGGAMERSVSIVRARMRASLDDVPEEEPLPSAPERPALAAPGTKLHLEHTGLSIEEAQEQMEYQVGMWSEINAQYREYEICCRDAATFVSSFKPVMSSALMQAALQMEGDVQTLMVRARQDMLVDTSTFPAVALAELRGISAELKAQEAAAATFHQHQGLLSSVPLKELSNVVIRAQSMVDSRIQLWERFDGWQTFLTELGVKNVLKSPVIQAEEVARQRHLLVEVVEEMEALHVDPDERSIDTVTPGEATLLGQVRSITDQYLRYQPLVEKLCDSAMQQRHINLLLLELSLIDEYPRACTPSEVYAQATAGVETLLRQRSVRRNRSMSMSSFAAALVPNAVKDESGPGDNEPQLPVVSFTTLLKKAANTEESQAMVDSMWTMAVEEKKLVDRLESLSDSWNELYFLFHTRRVFGIYPFTNLEGLLSILGEGKLALDGVAQSPFLLGVRRKYEHVENMLAILQDRVEGIQRCQSLWLSLSRLMQRPEVHTVMSYELGELEQAVSDWKMLGLNLQQSKTSLVSASMGLDPALTVISGLKATFSRLQSRCLMLLAPVREEYPRLYFVDDHDLLHAIAATDTPHLLGKPFLASVFPGVEGVRTKASSDHDQDKEPNACDIDSVIGIGGEVVPLMVPVRVHFHSTLAGVMRALGEALAASMLEHTHRSLSACAIMKGAEWVNAFPLQSTLLVDSMVWTDSVTNALRASFEGERGALRQLLQQSSLRLETMARQVQQAALVVEASAQHLAEGGAIQRGSDQESTHSEAAQVAQPAPGTPETPATAEHERSQATIFPEPSQAFLEAAHIVRGFKALIQVGVYHRSVVEGLINAQVTEPTDFEWQRQLRYYWDRDLSTCLVNIADTSARYGFEYQGAEFDYLHGMTPVMFPGLLAAAAGLESSPIVSLTCPPDSGAATRAAAQAMAGAFGRLYVPVTCSSRMDFRATASVLRALIESGAWSSFEGCDSLMPEVLSQLAQQIYTIKEGIASQKSVIEIGSLEIKVHAGFQEMSPSFVMFLTGQSSAMYSPAWPRPDELATDRQLPEATRWLSRRVHLQPMAMELPVEAALRMLGLAHPREAAAALGAMLKMTGAQIRGLDTRLLGLATVKCIISSLRHTAEGEPERNSAFEHLRRAADTVLVTLAPPESRPAMRAMLLDFLSDRTHATLPQPVSPLPRPRSMQGFFPRQAGSAGVQGSASESELRIAVQEAATNMQLGGSEIGQLHLAVLNVAGVATAAMTLHQAMVTAPVTVLVGAAGVGKSVVRRALRAGLEATGSEVVEKHLFPSSLSLESLFGSSEGAAALGGGLPPFSFGDGRAPPEAGLAASSRRSSYYSEAGESGNSDMFVSEGNAGQGVLRRMLAPRPELEAAELVDVWTTGGGGGGGAPISLGMVDALRSSMGSEPDSGRVGTPPRTGDRSPFGGSPHGSLGRRQHAQSPLGPDSQQAGLQSPTRGRASGVQHTWLVVDGPLAGPQSAILFPLVAGGHLYQGSTGGKLALRPSTQVVWETDSLAGMTPAEAASVRVVHLGVGPVADAETTFEAIVDALPSRLPHATLDESTLAKLPPLFLSVLRIWQRYPSVALQDRQEMAERLQKAATYVGELFLQVMRDNLSGMMKAATDTFVKMAFVFCLLWGLGGCLTTEKQRKRLETTLRQYTGGAMPELPLPEGSLWDLRLSHRRCKWVRWSEDITEMLASKTVSQGDTQLVVRFQGLSVGGEGADMRVIVPTPMTVSRQHLASLTLASGGHPLVVGPASSGKSLLLRHLLAASPLLTPSSTHTMYNCLSVASTGLEMQDDLLATLIRVHPTLLRPVIGRAAVMVVDDMHMPLQAPEGAGQRSSTVAQQPEPLEWLRQVSDAHSVLDMSTGARVLVPKLQLMGAALGSGFLSGATRASQRLLRHWSVIAMYDDDWRAGRGALLDPVTGHPAFPPLEAPAMLLQGIAHRLLLATSEAVSHVHSDGLARELATATVSAATSLLRTEAAMRALGPGPDAGSVDLGVLSPGGAGLAGTNGQADAAPPPQAKPTGSGTSSRDGSTAPQPPPSLLTFKRLERILLRVRSVLVKQTRAVQDDIIILSMLRKHVGYIWVHEAARELTDDLPIEVARTLRRELVDHAASAFSAFNEGVVTHPPRCKGMSRVQWASLMVEASEMDVWQLAPVDLPQLHAEMTLATDIKLGLVGAENNANDESSDSDLSDDTEDEFWAKQKAAYSRNRSRRSLGAASTRSRALSIKGLGALGGGLAGAASSRSMAGGASFRSLRPSLSMRGLPTLHAQTFDPDKTWPAVARLRLDVPELSTAVSRLQWNLSQSFELGNTLLVGPPCSGRTSAACLAAERMLGWRPVVVQGLNGAGAELSDPAFRANAFLQQMRTDVGGVVMSGGNAIVIVTDSMTEDNAVMAVLQELLTGWRLADRLIDLVRIDNGRTKTEEMSDLRERVARATSVTRARSFRGTLNLDIPNAPGNQPDLEAEESVSVEVGGEHPAGPSFALKQPAAVSTPTISNEVFAQRSENGVLLPSGKSPTASGAGMAGSNPQRATAARRGPLQMPPDEAVIVSATTVGGDGSAMFGADNGSAVRLLRSHARALELSEDSANVAAATTSKRAVDANTAKERAQFQWRLEKHAATQRVRKKMRVVLMVGQQRYNELHKLFPALMAALQVTRVGDVQPRELQTKAADWMRTDAMVALLPPQLKAVHEFYKKPPPKYEAPAHELRNAKDVFQVARSHAYGPELKQYPQEFSEDEEEQEPGTVEQPVEGGGEGSQPLLKAGTPSKATISKAALAQKSEEIMTGAAEKFNIKMPAVSLQQHTDATLAEEIKAEGLPPGSTSSQRMAKALLGLHAVAQQVYAAYSEDTGIRCVAPVSKIREVVNLLGPLLSQHRKLLSNGQAALHISVGKLQIIETAETTSAAETDVVAPRLEAAAEHSAKMLVRLTSKQQRVDELHAAVMADEQRVQDAMAEQNSLRAQADAQLQAAQDAYDMATELVVELHDEDINELRSYFNPPGLVQKVMEAVCILFDQPIDWKSARQLLAGHDPSADKNDKHRPKRSLKSQVLNYDLSGVDDSMLNKLQYFKNNPSFNPSAVSQVSKAAKSLCVWVLAIESHASMRRAFKMRYAKANEADLVIRKIRSVQEAKQVQLDAARELLGQVQLQYDTAAENEAMLAHQLESLRTKSGHCQRMRVALSQSKEKWTARMESIEEQTARLQGDSLLAACCIVYLGLLPEPVRAELVEKWKSVLQHTVRIPYTLDFQLPAFMALRDMSGRYIPRKVQLDSLRKENMFISRFTRQTPLLFDPSGEGYACMRALHPAHNWQTIGMDESGCVSRALDAVAAGGSVLLRLDEYTINLNMLTHLASAYQELVSKKADAFDEGHRLYVYVQGRQFTLPPLVHELFTILDFTLGGDGLEERVLSIITSRLLPKLEQRKRQLMIAKGTQSLASTDLESKILKFISKATAVLWDDPVLVENISSNADLLDRLHAEVYSYEGDLARVAAIEGRYRGAAQLACELYHSLSALSPAQPAFSMPLNLYIGMLKRALQERGIGAAAPLGGEGTIPEAAEVQLQSGCSVELVIIASLLRQLARRLPACLTRVLGLTFASRVLERTGHVVGDERRFLFHMLATPSGLESLRHTGVPTGTNRCAIPLAAQLNEQQEEEPQRAAENVPVLGLANMGSAVSRSSASLSMAGRTPSEVLAGMQAASKALGASLSSMSGSAARPLTVKSLSAKALSTVRVGSLGRRVPSFAITTASSTTDRRLSRQGSAAATSGYSSDNDEEPFLRPMRASISAGRAGGPLPFDVTPVVLLKTKPPRSWKAGTVAEAPPPKHAPLFGGKLGRERLESKDTQWPTRALLDDLLTLEEEYPDKDAFYGIIDAVQREPAAWRAVCLSPCPPEALPRPWGAPPRPLSAARPLSSDALSRPGSSGSGQLTPLDTPLGSRAGTPLRSGERVASQAGQVAADEGEVDEQEDVGSLTDFQKVVLCAVVCPNRLAVCVDWLLRRLLGPDVHAEESQAMRLSGTLTDSPPSAPLLLHTWYGEEPARTIQQLAECYAVDAESPFTNKMLQNLAVMAAPAGQGTEKPEVVVVSMGQGQTVEADMALAEARSAGHWVVVLNAHMDYKWCADMALQLRNTDPSELSPRFRLWLCTQAPNLADAPGTLLNSATMVALSPARSMLDFMVRAYVSVFAVKSAGDMTSRGPEADRWRTHIFGLASTMCALNQFYCPSHMLTWTDADLHKGIQLLQRIFANMPNPRFLDYPSLQRLLRYLVFVPAMPGERAARRTSEALSRLMTHDILSFHYPIHCHKPRGEQDEPLIPNNLAELTSFLRKEVPARVTKQTLLTTKPWLDLQHEGGESVELARALKDCIPAEAGTQLLPGLLPLASMADAPFMSSERLALWVHELMNTAGVAISLAASYSESIKLAGTGQRPGKSKLELLLLQAMLDETQHIMHIFQVAATDLQAVVSALSFPSYTSEYTLQVLQALSEGRIPPRWMPDGIVGAGGNAPTGDAPDLADWRYVLQSRLEFLRAFRDLPHGQPPVWNLWLLAYPQAVLAATMRAFAMDNGISTAAVGFRSVVMKPQEGDEVLSMPPSSGLYVGNLFLQGARWDVSANCLEELDNGEVCSRLPPVWLMPSHRGALANSSGLNGMPMWECPVYAVPGHALAPEDREIAALRLETRRGPEVWTRADVMAVLSVTGVAT